MTWGRDRMNSLDLGMWNNRQVWTIHMGCWVGIWSQGVGKERAHTQNGDGWARRQELNAELQTPFQN